LAGLAEITSPTEMPRSVPFPKIMEKWPLVSDVAQMLGHIALEIVANFIGICVRRS